MFNLTVPGNSIVFTGLGYGARLGSGVVSGAGDINGDGIADLLLNAEDSGQGSVFVVFGRTTPFDVDLENLGDDGFVITSTTSHHLGRASAIVGDVNGDGFDDIAVGQMRLGDDLTGKVRVIFGSADLPPTIDVDNLGDGGFTIPGPAGSWLTGLRVFGTGDVDGDGTDDFAFSAGGIDDVLGVGATFVYRGGNTNAPDPHAHVSHLAGTATNGVAGYSIAVGDVDGDGEEEFLVGGNAFYGGVGIVQAGGSFPGTNLSLPTDASGRILNGNAIGSSASRLAVDDFNGDGIDDIVVGSPNIGFRNKGGFSVIFGQDLDGLSLMADVRSAFTVGREDDGFIGSTVAALGGDFNGDGFNDFVVGGQRGEAFLIFGGPTLNGDLGDLDSLDPSVGLKIIGPDPENAPLISVFAPGDVNGDGLADIGIGSSWAHVYSGQVDLILGSVLEAPASNDDNVAGGDDGELLDAGAGDDTVFGQGGDDILEGGGGIDVLAGGDENDSIYGGVGNDRGWGQGGDDLLRGGDGDDWLAGNRGNDYVFGDAGEDTLRGQPGDDDLRGGDDADLAFGGADSDTIQGEDGDDTLNGNSGFDVIAGGDGNDLLRGQGGRDLIDGGAGDDSLLGMFGFDTLIGDWGNDTLVGGPANDMLTGGSEADVFVFAAGHGDDTITDFDVGFDLLSLAGLTFADLSIVDTPDGARLTITAEGDASSLSILLAGLESEDVNVELFATG